MSRNSKQTGRKAASNAGKGDARELRPGGEVRRCDCTGAVTQARPLTHPVWVARSGRATHTADSDTQHGRSHPARPHSKEMR